MVVTEQVDALRMCGVEPIEYLIVPRFIATLAMETVLSFFGVAFAILMGALTAYASFRVNPHVFFDLSGIGFREIATGVAKCLAYGAAIPIVSGYCGLTAQGGSEGVGHATTRAVIGASFAVIVLDFILSGLSLLIFTGGGGR